MQDFITDITQLADTIAVPLILGYLAYKIIAPEMRAETAFIDAIFLIIIFTSLGSMVLAQINWLLAVVGLGAYPALAGWVAVVLGALAVILIARLWPAVWRLLDRLLPRA